MAKKKMLTEADRFYIKSHLDVPVEELAKTINTYEKTIEEEIERAKKGILVDDLLIKNKDRGVVVMTEGASSLADDRRVTNRRDRRYKEGVTRPIK